MPVRPLMPVVPVAPPCRPPRSAARLVRHAVVAFGAAALASAASHAPQRLSMPPVRAQSAPTFRVDTTDDARDAVPGDGLCADAAGRCTLRAAVEEAGAITPPPPQAVDVVLPAGDYALTLRAGDDGLASTARLLLRGRVALHGAPGGGTILRVVGGTIGDDIWTLGVEAGATAAAERITLQGGRGNGGIRVDGRLVLAQVVVRGMRTTRLSGIEVVGALAMSDCAVVDNETLGGGLLVYGSLTMVRTSVLANHGAQTAGGLTVVSFGSMASIEASTFASNVGPAVGAISASGAVTITNSTVSDNHASRDAAPGGIYQDGGSLLLDRSTVTGNGGRLGAGLTSSIGARLRGSIVAGNGDADVAAAAGIRQCAAQYRRADIVSLGANVVGDDSCGEPAAGDVVAPDPRLGPLADNVGPTLTHAPLAGSPAIDLGGDACPARDQRGAPRPNGAACDARAVELDAPAAPGGPTAMPVPTPAPPPGPLAPGSVLDPRGRFDGAVVAAGRGAGALCALFGTALHTMRSNPDGTLEPIGRVDLGNAPSDLAVHGDTAYALFPDGAVAVVDIASPAAPRVQGRVASPYQDDPFTGVTAGIAIAAVDDGWLYVRSYRQIGRSVDGTLTPLDATDRSKPRWASGFAVDGGVVQEIEDLTITPGRAVMVVSYPGGFGKWISALVVADRADPARWRELGRVALPNPGESVAVADGRAFVAVRPVPANWDLREQDKAMGGVEVVSLDDPAAPRRTGGWPAPDRACRHVVSNGSTLAALCDDAAAASGLRWVPFDARAVSPVPLDAGTPLDIAGAFLGSSGAEWYMRTKDGGLRSLVDPAHVRAAPHPIGPVPAVAAIDDGERSAFVAAVARPAADQAPLRPAEAPLLRLTAADVAADGAIGLAAMPDGVRVVVASTVPGGAPTVVDPPLDLVARAVAVNGRRGLALGAADDGLYPIDLSDPRAPILGPPVAHAFKTVAIRPWGDAFALLGDFGLKVFDPGDGTPGSVRETLLQLDAPARDVSVAADRAFVASGAGLVVFDIARPLEPVEVARYALPDGAQAAAIALDGGLALVGAGDRIVALDVTNLGKVRWLDAAPAPGIRRLAVVGEEIVAALGDNGLAVLRRRDVAGPTWRTACGATSARRLRLAGGSAGGWLVAIEIDGVAAAQAVVANRAFGVDVDLAPGRHRIVAVAYAPLGGPRRSAVLDIDVDESLPFDPLGVTLTQTGPLGDVPVGPHGPPNGCVEADGPWTVSLAPDGGPVTVRVPVGDVATTVVTATLGAAAVRLAPEAGAPASGPGVVAGTLAAPGNAGGDAPFGLVVRRGAEAAIDVGGRAVWRRVWLPITLR